MHGSGETIEDILGQLDTVAEEVDQELEDITMTDGIIVQLVNKMIIDAHIRGASDIHIEPKMG